MNARFHRLRPLVALAALIPVAVLATACGSSSSSGDAGQKLSVKLVDSGCSPNSLTAKSGKVTVDVQNGGTSKVTELELKNAGGIILGESENVVAGIGGSFTLTLQPGTYTLSCPNGSEEDGGKLVVSGGTVSAGAGSDAALLAKATAGYKTYVEGQSAQLLAGTKQFVAALKAGNLAQAEALFGPVRYHYEAIEPVAESFGNLDPEIDARENDVASPADWTGFHRIEKILWEQNTTAGTSTYATKLLADVTTLNGRVKTLNYQAAQLANGGVELLNEVANSKITGEEDRYSHTDLSDFAANVEGAQKAFELLEPALQDVGEGALAKTIAARFAAVDKGLAKYKRSTPLGYALYSALTAADRRTFATEVDALAEPLSTVAGKVT